MGSSPANPTKVVCMCHATVPEHHIGCKKLVLILHRTYRPLTSWWNAFSGAGTLRRRHALVVELADTLDSKSSSARSEGSSPSEGTEEEKLLTAV